MRFLRTMLGHFEIAAFEVQAVRRHELHVVALAGFDHAFAVVHAGGQRLLAQHVQAGLGRADRPCGVLRVGQRDVHRVDGAAVEQLARVGVRDRVSSTP